MGKIGKYALTLLVVIVMLLIAGSGIKTIGIVPDHAIVYLNDDTKEYHSPLGLTQEQEGGMIRSTKGQAEASGYEMNDEEREYGYFQEDGRSLTGMLFEKIGILPKQIDRIDTNGNWNY